MSGASKCVKPSPDALQGQEEIERLQHEASEAAAFRTRLSKEREETQQKASELATATELLEGRLNDLSEVHAEALTKLKASEALASRLQVAADSERWGL